MPWRIINHYKKNYANENISKIGKLIQKLFKWVDKATEV